MGDLIFARLTSPENNFRKVSHKLAYALSSLCSELPNSNWHLFTGLCKISLSVRTPTPPKLDPLSAFHEPFSGPGAPKRNAQDPMQRMLRDHQHEGCFHDSVKHTFEWTVIRLEMSPQVAERAEFRSSLRPVPYHHSAQLVFFPGTTIVRAFALT